jgi:hypothetical protein
MVESRKPVMVSRALALRTPIASRRPTLADFTRLQFARHEPRWKHVFGDVIAPSSKTFSAETNSSLIKKSCELVSFMSSRKGQL